MKRLIILLLSIVLLAGCSASAKSAEQHGEGVSIEMSHSLDIKHMTLSVLVNGKEAFNGGVINADNSSFKKGEIIWFDVSLSANENKPVELAISYSRNSDGTEARKTNKIDIYDANDWVTILFNEDYQLEVIDKK